MSSRDFHFMPVNYTLRRRDQTWRRELEVARGHAARITQLRRERRDAVEEEQARELQIARSPVDGLLDPFVRLPTEVSVADRNLLHAYLQQVPGEFYGTSASSLLCPVRDVTLGILASSRILLSWAVLFVRYRQNILRLRDPEQDPEVLRQRLLTYRLVAQQVFDREGAISLDAMYATAFSALLEHRIGDRQTAQKHLKACLAIRRARMNQSLTITQYPLGMLCIPVCALVGAPGYFKSQDEVRSSCDNMIRVFEAFSQWRPYRARQLPSHAQPVSLRSTDLLEQTLRQHMLVSSMDASRLWLASAVALNIASLGLYGAVNDYEVPDQNELLELLTHCLETATPTTIVQDEQHKEEVVQRASITPLGLLYTIFMCIDRLGLNAVHGGTPPAELWDTVEMVELLTYAPHELLLGVKQYMLSCLFDKDQGPESLTPVLLSALVQSIEAAWVVDQNRVVELP